MNGCVLTDSSSRVLAPSACIPAHARSSVNRRTNSARSSAPSGSGRETTGRRTSRYPESGGTPRRDRSPTLIASASRCPGRSTAPPPRRARRRPGRRLPAAAGGRASACPVRPRPAAAGARTGLAGPRAVARPRLRSGACGRTAGPPQRGGEQGAGEPGGPGRGRCRPEQFAGLGAVQGSGELLEAGDGAHPSAPHPVTCRFQDGGPPVG